MSRRLASRASGPFGIAAGSLARRGHQLVRPFVEPDARVTRDLQPFDTLVPGDLRDQTLPNVNTTITAPAGGYSSLPAAACTATTCTLAQRQVLLYLDSQTYTPVRTVVITLNPHDIQGPPPGTTVTAVADYSIQALPDTPANEALVQMTAHPGATQIQATLAQYNAEHGLDLVPSPGPGATTNTGPTGPTGAASQTGATGMPGTSTSGASGANGATAAN